MSEEILLLAKVGDKEAIEQIIDMYKLLLHKKSFVDNVFDKDLLQVLVLELLNSIDKFQI